MALNRWQGSTTAVAQVAGGAMVYSSGSVTFTATLTDDNGNTVAIATAGVTNSDTSCDNLVTAWNASTDPRLTGITASNVSSGTFTLTADTAGVPFSVASLKSGGGTGTFDAMADSVASAGPNDYGIAGNWSLNAVPVANNDVEIPSGSPAILYTLNQSGVEIDDFRRLKGHTNSIGRIENGFFYSLRLDLGDSNILEDSGGSSLTMYDVKNAAITPKITNTGTPTTGRHAVYIKGSAMAAIDIIKGNVGIGTEIDDTTTSVTAIRVTAGTVTIGEGVTNSTIVQQAGTVHNYANVATLTVYNGSYYQEKGIWSTEGKLYGGTAYCNATGTYVLATVKKGASLLNTIDLRTKTFTNLTLEAGSTCKDPNKLITFTNNVKHPDGDADVTSDFGTQIEFKPVSY